MKSLLKRAGPLGAVFPVEGNSMVFALVANFEPQKIGDSDVAGRSISLVRVKCRSVPASPMPNFFAEHGPATVRLRGGHLCIAIFFFLRPF
jgi:hypothetical protein